MITGTFQSFSPHMIRVGVCALPTLLKGEIASQVSGVSHGRPSSCSHSSWYLGVAQFIFQTPCGALLRPCQQQRQRQTEIIT